MKREIKQCKRCDHVWLPRKATVKIIICPSCKSPYWATEPKTKHKRRGVSKNETRDISEFSKG